jgi:predicted ATPase
LRSGTADREAGIAKMREGLALLRSRQDELFTPLRMTLLAEAEAEAGRPDVALGILDTELANIERTEQRWYSAEVHRARGEILLKCKPRQEAEAAKLFELQAAVSVAALWTAQDKRAEAHELIAPICAWFDPGLDCDALRKARVLLE